MKNCFASLSPTWLRYILVNLSSKFFPTRGPYQHLAQVMKIFNLIHLYGLIIQGKHIKCPSICLGTLSLSTHRILPLDLNVASMQN